MPPRRDVRAAGCHNRRVFCPRVAGTLILGVALVVPLLAHDDGHAVVPGPSGWDVAVLVLLGGLGLLYAIGSWRLARRKASLRLVERVGFWVGWMAMVAAVAPPLDAAAAQRFSMHMLQHELLMLVGAPLVIVGRPIVAWLWALPETVRPTAGAALQGKAATSLWRWLTMPLVAWALHGFTLWVWHLPALYEAAVHHEGIHAFQHATFVATAIFFWWGLVYGRYGRVAYGASVLYVFTTMVHSGILGALFTLSNRPFYGVYRDRAEALAIDPARDQQLAGLYMWIPASVVLMIFGLALALAWLSEAERRAAIREPSTPRGPAAPPGR
jgi:putative membrane protein